MEPSPVVGVGPLLALCWHRDWGAVWKRGVGGKSFFPADVFRRHLGVDSQDPAGQEPAGSAVGLKGTTVRSAGKNSRSFATLRMTNQEKGPKGSQIEHGVLKERVLKRKSPVSRCLHLIDIRLSLICPNLGWTRRYTLRCHLTVKANLLSRKFSRNKVLPIWNKEQ